MIQAQYRRPARSRVAYPLAGSNRSGTLSKALGTRGLGEAHPEAVAAALVATGHLRRSLDDVLLDVAFVALGRRGELGAQRVSEEFLLWLAFREIAAHACREREALDQARDVAVATCSDPTSRPTAARNMGPRAMRANFSRASSLATGAGALGGTAADLDLARTGFAAQSEEHAVVEEFGPAPGESDRTYDGHHVGRHFRIRT